MIQLTGTAFSKNTEKNNAQQIDAKTKIIHYVHVFNIFDLGEKRALPVPMLITPL